MRLPCRADQPLCAGRALSAIIGNLVGRIVRTNPLRTAAVMTMEIHVKQNDQESALDAVWVQMCKAEGLDPERRLAARLAVLGSADAQDCTVYRPDDNDPDAEEEDLGDARILFTGPFQVPAEWSEVECAEFFDDADPELFVTALIECEAAPSARGYFAPEIGDYVAATLASGEVAMFYVQDCSEDERGRQCVLIRDDEPLF
ncbi:hypothetical protein D3C78_468840 [compost metagenome]